MLINHKGGLDQDGNFSATWLLRVFQREISWNEHERLDFAQGLGVGWFGVGGGCLLSLVPDKFPSPAWYPVSALLAYPPLLAKEERDEEVDVGPWQQSKQGEVVVEQH